MVNISPTKITVKYEMGYRLECKHCHTSVEGICDERKIARIIRQYVHLHKHDNGTTLIIQLGAKVKCV
jgi:hypothetical protein